MNNTASMTKSLVSVRREEFLLISATNPFFLMLKSKSVDQTTSRFVIKCINALPYIVIGSANASLICELNTYVAFVN